MSLPRAADAIVDPAKVRDYLLAQEHPVGRAKARFFARLGFRQENWRELRQLLLEMARTGVATPGRSRDFGQTYLLHDTIRGPTGATAGLVTVWIVIASEGVPRFVTAYPGEVP